MMSANYARAKKESALVDQLLEQSFPRSHITKLEKRLEAYPTDQDPRSLFEKACRQLKELTNDVGNSILHEAVLQGHKSLCRLFVQHGFQYCKNNDEETPLHLTIRVNSVFAFSVLVAGEAGFLVENKAKQTPVELALKLKRLDYVRRLCKLVKSLDEIVPKERQYLFLSFLWETKDADLLSLVAKRFFSQACNGDYVCDFSQKGPAASVAWILHPTKSASSLQLHLSQNEWDTTLMHLLQERAFLFAEDASHMHKGLWIREICVPLLWTWRSFWQTRAESNPLFVQIDRAIGAVLVRPSIATYVRKIREGIEPVILESGWERHALTVVFINNLLFICNAGENEAIQKQALTVYKFKKCNITKNLVQRIVSYPRNAKASERSLFLFETLPKSLGAIQDSFCVTIHQDFQPCSHEYGICTAKSLRVAIRSILLAHAPMKGEGRDFKSALNLYRDYVQFARYLVLKEYLTSKKK